MNPPGAGHGPGPLTDRELLAAYRDFQTQRNLSPESTVRKYAALHRAWVNWLDDRDRTLLTADRDDVVTFLAGRRLSPRSRYTYISRLSALYRWLIDEGHTDQDPTARVPRPELPEPLPRPIATGDLRMALELAAPRTRAFMALAAFAGLRCKEVAGLRVDDVLETLSPPVLIVTSPKGRRERVVPLHAEVSAALRGYGMPRAGFAFPYWGDPSRPIRPHTVSHYINRHLHALGISSTAHTLRAWFATQTYRLSLDLVMVQQLLGHQSASSTRHYVALVAAAAAPVVSGLSVSPDPRVVAT